MWVDFQSICLRLIFVKKGPTLATDGLHMMNTQHIASLYVQSEILLSSCHKELELDCFLRSIPNDVAMDEIDT